MKAYVRPSRGHNINKASIASLDTKTTNSFTATDARVATLRNNVDLLNADETTENSVKYMIKSLNDDSQNTYLDKSKNLADLTSNELAIANMGIMSKTSIESYVNKFYSDKINSTSNSLGIFDEMSDMEAMDVTTVSNGDRIKITNARNLTDANGAEVKDEDGNAIPQWAIFRAVVDLVLKDDGSKDVDASTITWEVENRQEGSNAWSAVMIKESYENNDDTNAFQDAEKVKVGHISITAARNLDKLIQSDELIAEIESKTAADGTTIPSVSAVKKSIRVTKQGLYVLTQDDIDNGTFALTEKDEDDNDVAIEYETIMVNAFGLNPDDSTVGIALCRDDADDAAANSIKILNAAQDLDVDTKIYFNFTVVGN